MTAPPSPAQEWTEATPEEFWRSVGEWAVEQGFWQAAPPQPAEIDVERDQRLYREEVEDWYAAFEQVSGTEARTFDGRMAIYNDFQRLHSDRRNARLREGGGG